MANTTIYKPVMAVSQNMDSTTQANFNLLNKFIQQLNIPQQGSNSLAQYYASAVSSMPSTNSTSYVLMPDMNINFSLSVGGIISVDFSGSFIINTIFYGNNIIMNMNGSNISATERYYSEAVSNVSIHEGFFWSGSIGSGNFNIQTLWKINNAASTLYCSGLSRSMRVLVWGS